MIEMYARSHHIALSPANRRAAQHTAAKLLAAEGGLHGGSQAMLAAIVRREMLVQRVEAVVTAAIPTGGSSYHLRRYFVPAFGSRQRTYHAAVQLALGAAAPPGTQEQTGWTAVFRVSPQLRGALRQAGPGHSIGPFHRAGGYEVVDFLGLAHHRYGAAARHALASKQFASWLRARLRAAGVACYTPRGNHAACPGLAAQSVTNAR